MFAYFLWPLKLYYQWLKIHICLNKVLELLLGYLSQILRHFQHIHAIWENLGVSRFLFQVLKIIAQSQCAAEKNLGTQREEHNDQL